MARFLALSLAALLIAVAAMTPAAAFDSYSLDHRPKVTFKGGAVHVSPYPASRRAAAVWASDACFRQCTGTCTWKMEACVRATDADACRPHLDGCDRACQRECRTGGGPLMGWLDF